MTATAASSPPVRPLPVGWGRVAIAVLRHPDLWAEGLRAARRMAGSGWWRHWPPVPRPPDAYLRFRVQTATGDADAPADPRDVVTYLAWCRDNRRHLA